MYRRDLTALLVRVEEPGVENSNLEDDVVRLEPGSQGSLETRIKTLKVQFCTRSVPINIRTDQ